MMFLVRTPASLPSLMKAALGTVVMPRRVARPLDL